MGDAAPGTRSLAAGCFFGQVRTTRDYGSFQLTRLRHDHGLRLPVHMHERSYFCLVEHGGYAESLARTAIEYPARSVLFHPPGIVHRDEIGPRGARFLIVEIAGDLYERAFAGTSAAASRQDLCGGELAWAADRLDRECRDPARRSPLVIEGLVLEMLGIVARGESDQREREPAWLTRVIERLHTDFDRHLTLERLARGAGVDPVRLSRVFRRRMGVPVGEYVLRLRVSWVEARLRDPDTSLAQIAAAAGFVDQSHMTRVFRRITGRTPGNARGLRRAR